MVTVEEIMEKLRQRLIAHDGNIAPHDLIDIIAEAQETGIDREQIARLLPEVDRSINWEHIRAEKAKKEEEAREVEARKQQREAEIAAAPEYLDALISYCLADGIAEAAELRTIFNKAEALEQNIYAVAGKVKSLLDKEQFRPYPNADLNAPGLHEVLMSTNWYTEKTYPRITAQAIQSQSGPEQELQAAPVRIHSFSADKTDITAGETVTLYWEVSGIDHITITNLGRTSSLKNQQAVKPDETTRYVLYAGGQQRELVITVQPRHKTNRLAKVLMWIVIIFLLVKLGQWGTGQIGDLSGTASSSSTGSVGTSSHLMVGQSHTSSVFPGKKNQAS